MAMDLDSSFGEFADDRRFIALVVSDNEDDYDSSTDEAASDDESLEATPKANITPLGVRNSSNLNILNQDTSHSNNNNNNYGANNNKTPVPNSPRVSGSVRSPATTKSNKDEKKRWSFISNHSSTSSNNAKKRWSTLSSFTDSKDKDAKRDEKEKDKFVRRVPTQGSGSVSSHKRISIDQHFEHSPTSKRSSTGSSLKQLFGLIALNDENKENHYPQKKQESAKVPSTASTRGQPLKERRNTNVETPSSQRNSAFLGKTEMPRRQSRLHTHSPSISSLSSLTSSSKWKFWQRSGNSIRDRTISRPLSTHSLVGPPTDPTTKTKSSFSELHKAIYANNNSTFEDNSSSISNSLSKRLSSSNLSLGNLKHRSSQSSLKHKSSQSSLQRFKTRRKSNNMAEEGSISSSGSHSHHPKISLPVVDQMSRDKIKTKLRNSSSLLSLHSSLPIMMKDYDEVVLQQILEYCDVSKELPYDDDYIPVLKNATELSTHVWRAQSEGTNVIYKKLPLETLEDVTYSKSMCLHELKMLRLSKGTTGLPYLLRSFVIRERPIFDEETASTTEGKLYLLIILRDNGTPLSQIKLNTWPQALKIFWQVVTTLYVAETKFEFEHRSLSLDHILVDDHLNVTLCDLKGARAYWASRKETLFTRLDHPLFFQGGGDYQFDVYNLMRAILSETSWDNYEPRTNLLWLHFLLYKLFHAYGDKLVLQGRERLAALAQLLDPSSNARRSIFKRNEREVRSCGDLLRFK
ncbi:ZYRO0G09922p [Zygosaccharomyces rouxii]|uniref:non-specific serine/threonine protein kinase n=1 Tax=Zygosaccharomyces rouxii (strain ATCC 2623 / CBS 732 / NBRC 1130 / NCYC 568 / NRRL Y-229) TaxID=559307 RepID=C5E056_ZYGRC|nr:uncharacterized protein ZYRO0G09922g [Zygosaccharomyces rouxii]KAH9202485.1 hypothetical protein LQ764DRAFT_25892 [Zygosaccharomyces rouxii]CAR29490.1 ZYRO0G09922p [Zygosaccharomyces rouxii]